MITSIQSYVQQGRHILRRFALDPKLHRAARIAAYLLCGFLLSAASLGHYAQPLAMGLVTACSGWQAILSALGASAGYWVFWGKAGLQGPVWMAAGLLIRALLGRQQTGKVSFTLVPAAAALAVAATGLFFQSQAGDSTPPLMYLLRIVLSCGSTVVFSLADQRRDPIAKWFVWGIAVLALAQVSPIPWLNFGYIAAGALSLAGAFPAAALAGLALDLAQVTPVPMTAVTALTYFLRLLPRSKKWLLCCSPGLVYCTVMSLCGLWDMTPVPGLVLGGLVVLVLPGQSSVAHRRGETGVAQVRLEMLASTFSQMQQLLLDAPGIPIDEEALVRRGAERACSSCPCRKSCREKDTAARLPAQLLHKPLLDGHDLPISCRKEGRMLQELHRSQEQLRSIRGDRERQKEYRSAVLQQYQFLAEYLQDLSDTLSRHIRVAEARFKPEFAFAANREQADNGDRCLAFAGTGSKYYIILCDGMGTGLGAVDEGRTAGSLLKKLLEAGFPAEYALRSINSLCALRGAAGAVTVDLAELQLDTGKATLYKWGAPASYLLRQEGSEKIGTAGPPPGLSVTDGRETVLRLSLRRGETLVLLSDGVGGEDALRCCFAAADELPGELAARILESGNIEGTDDATVAVVRLSSELSGA